MGLIGSNHVGNCRVLFLCVCSRDIRDFATIVKKGHVTREGCRVLSNTPRVGGGGSSKKILCMVVYLCENFRRSHNRRSSIIIAGSCKPRCLLPFFTFTSILYKHCFLLLRKKKKKKKERKDFTAEHQVFVNLR